jgi:LPXTG-motif cell wall-anchored protein
VYQLLPSNDKNKTSLSTAAYAGIGVGAVVFLVLLGLLFWFLRRRKRKTNEVREKKLEEASPPEMELDSRSLAEVNGALSPQELGDGIVWPAPQELNESTDIKRIVPGKTLDKKNADHKEDDVMRDEVKKDANHQEEDVKKHAEPQEPQEPQELDGTPTVRPTKK